MMFFFQLSEGGKSSQIKHFQDKTNKTALPIIDLIDAMKTGVIDYSVVKTGSKLTGEVQTASIALQMSQKCISPIRIAYPTQSTPSTWLERLELQCMPYLKI